MYIRNLTRHIFVPALFAILALGTGSTSNAQETKTITVSAAASLRETAQTLAQSFEKQNAGVKVQINFGGSNLLARQIEEGAPVDVFVSADRKTMDGLQEKKLISKDSRTDLLGNTLVMISAPGSKLKIDTPSQLGVDSIAKIAICESAVPAGHYAETYLKKVGVFDKLQGRIVRTEDVRAALAAVQEGGAGAGWVYKTDANSTKGKVAIVWEAPGDPADPIVYPAAITERSKQKDLAAKFMEHLASEEARKVFTDAGFKFLPEPKK